MTDVRAAVPGPTWSRGESGASTLRLALAVVAGLLALACVLLSGARWVAPGVLPDSWTAADRADDRNIDITAAARRAMTTFLQVDYRTIDDQIEAVLKVSTGTFKKEFDAAKVQYAALTREGKAVTTGSIREVGITRSDEDEALVSVAADSTVVNEAVRDAQEKGEKVDNIRIYYFQLTMTRVGESWRLSNLEVIG